MGPLPPSFGSRRIGVLGFAQTGQAVARVLRRRGFDVVVVDDRRSDEDAIEAAALGVELVIAPTDEVLREIASECSEFVISPGVLPSHPIFSTTPTVELISEIELASRMTKVPIVAITGTNGKTTVTTLVDEMLRHSGMKSTAAGNIGPTLIDAVDRDDVEIIVAEVSSFQLALTSSFRPRVATWLNFAEDHLDWHDSIGDYARAKAKIFQAQDDGDVAIANRHDPVAFESAMASRARLVTFGATGADYHLEGDRFCSIDGADLGGVDLLARSLPHDIDNALAALATALESGATVEGCQAALSKATVLAHRVSFVSSTGGIDFYDDSKATTPSAVIAALAGFDSVVLICGGRNKGLDLSVIQESARRDGAHQLRAVVAIGEAAPQVAALFETTTQVAHAATMDEAVELAYGFGRPGDVVLLSPGCASFDWYRSYAERGDDFARAVHALTGTGPSTSPLERC